MKYEEWNISSKPLPTTQYKIGKTVSTIRESFQNPSKNRLYDNGQFFVYIDPNTYHLYNLFDYDKNANNLTLYNIDYNLVSAHTTSPVYEATHRLLLTKNKNTYIYTANAIYIGKLDTKYLYSLDVDAIDNMDIDDNGYFYSLTKLSNTEISDIKLSFNHVLYLSILNPIDDTTSTDVSSYALKFTIKNKKTDPENFINISDRTNFYNIYINNYTDNSQVEDYNTLNIFGDANSPEQIIIEVY